MKKGILLAIVAIICAISVFFLVQGNEPEQCPICQSLKMHAPCLVSLSSGAVTELELYQPHNIYVGEIDEIQDSSTFSFIHAAGLQGIRTTSPYVIKLQSPMGKTVTRLSAFCKSCRRLLSGQSCGYALIDLYEPEAPMVYEIYDGATYELRCYQIEIERDSEKSLYNLTVTGILEE